MTPSERWNLSKKIWSEITIKESLTSLLKFFQQIFKTVRLGDSGFAILGSVYFVVIKNLIWENKEDIDQELETVKVFLDKGIDIDGTFTPFIVPKTHGEPGTPICFSRGTDEVPITQGRRKTLWGKGVWKNTANRNHVWSRCWPRYLYLYFESKTELLAEIVKYVNHTLRKTSRIYQDGLTDRRTIENVGFQAFYTYLKTWGQHTA